MTKTFCHDPIIQTDDIILTVIIFSIFEPFSNYTAFILILEQFPLFQAQHLKRAFKVFGA